jgi:hypothetical protein
MEFSDIRQFELNTSRGNVMVRVMAFENGQLFLLSDSEKFRLGLTAIAIPPRHDRAEPTSTSFLSAGIDATHIRTIAERVSSWVGQTCMMVAAVANIDQAYMLELLTALKAHVLL